MNTPVDLSSLVSANDLPLLEGEGEGQTEDERERFYLTTAINYTNGEHGRPWLGVDVAVVR